jgi:hypothetical protein
MSLKKYLKKMKFWIAVYQYYLIGTLFETYYCKPRQLFHYYLYCLLFGVGCGLIFCGITDFLDWYPFEPLILSSDETNILNNDYNTIEISEKNLKDKEEIESAKKNICVWFVVSTVLWCAVFYTAYHYN